MPTYFEKVREVIGQGTIKANETYQYGSREITRVATDFSSELQKAAARNNIPSPLPDNLVSETDKAAKILSYFTDDEGGLKHVIPKEVIHNAKGIAIFTVVKAGLFWSARAGTGIVIARTTKGWSSPSGINIVGVGFGTQFGADVTNFVIILNTEEAVKAFSRGENITLGGSLSVSAGPVGMGTELSSSIYERSALYSYSNSKGFFAGVSLEGTIIMERKAANHEFYNKEVSAADILNGKVDTKSLSNSSLYEVLKRVDHDRK